LEEQRQALETAGAELRQANARLRDLDRMKNEFITTVTHELRTPLTSIRAFTEILADTPDLSDQERHRFLSVIQQESERLTRHINQVLDIAKIESGTMEWRVGDVDLGHVARSALGSMEQVYASHDVALSASLPAVPLPVRGDEDRLIQVLLNLLSNAVKFTEPGAGRVAVEAGTTAASAFVKVVDNGPGVPPEARELIFEKFRQVTDDGGLVRPEGTGLGLAISREIVQHLGGRLWVEEGPTGGAEFCFTLPLADREMEVAR
jgi:signal transduction histidine kinase